MYSSMGGGIIGIEMPLKTQNHVQKNPQIMGFSQQQTQLTMKQPNYTTSYNSNSNPTQKLKMQATQMTNSDEDEEQENSSNELKRKSSDSNNNVTVAQWQRMKWTDNMVRLLIMAVYYIGDEGVGGSETGPVEKKKAGNANGGAMQKKGKWKNVSRAMMEKGFYVSPQQCEDKFNDLNKRYKRVNDILGKGTSCKVVENISLLDDMCIDAKLKDEVKKLLNSKHLFFREMCAYHSSCAGAGVHAGSENGTVSVVSVKQQPIENQHEHQHQHQVMPMPMAHECLHSTPSVEEYEGEDEEDEDDQDEVEEGNVRKKARTGMREIDDWSGELMKMLQDGSKSSWEKKQWAMNQMVELEENGVKIQSEGLELEKERLKWMKFSSKKERDLERMRIENEKKKLENQRMLLLLKKNEIDILFVDQQKHPLNPSCLSM